MKNLHAVTSVLQLYDAMKGLPEHWWWCPHDNDAEQSKFCRIEPKQKMKVNNPAPVTMSIISLRCASKNMLLQDRVSAFNRWVNGRPEKVIVAFGHSSFWCEFLGGRTRLKNCEVHTHFV